jgi:glycine/D-amino acid oxidase-like deaminating enzyme
LAAGAESVFSHPDIGSAKHSFTAGVRAVKPDRTTAHSSVNRRALLKLLTAAAAGLLEVPAFGQPSPRIVVAGAGIIGASIAWHLARAGARVTVIDQAGPATQASRGTFAWINATWAKQPRSYHSLNQSSVSNWHALAQALELPVRWGGSLEWFADAARQRQLEQQMAEQSAWGEPARMLRPEDALALEPGISFGDAAAVARSGNDGAVDPVLATRAMLRSAVGMGAVLRYPCTLEGTRRQDGKLIAVDTNVGSIEADRLVLATGAAPDALLVQRVPGR